VEGRALRGLGVRGDFALLLDFIQVRLEFGVGGVAFVGLRPAEHAQHVLIGDGKDRILVRFRRIEQDIRQPARGFHFIAVGEAQRLLAKHDEHGIARHGIQRLDAAANEHRQAAERSNIKIVSLGFGSDP